MLAAALLASAAVVASSGAEAVLRARASLAADAAARRALARALAEWDVRGDTLTTGRASVSMLTLEGGDHSSELPISGTLRVQSLGASLLALTVDVRVGGAEPLARRRVSMVVQRPGLATTGGVRTAPVPIARWSVADLY